VSPIFAIVFALGADTWAGTLFGGLFGAAYPIIGVASLPLQAALRGEKFDEDMVFLAVLAWPVTIPFYFALRAAHAAVDALVPKDDDG
jgi:hypothetical protein